MTPFRNARGEFWNLYLNAGETVIITMNRVTMEDPYLYLLNPCGDRRRFQRRCRAPEPQFADSVCRGGHRHAPGHRDDLCVATDRG